MTFFSSSFYFTIENDDRKCSISLLRILTHKWKKKLGEVFNWAHLLKFYLFLINQTI